MNQLTSRIISALVAVLLVILIVWKFDVDGLRALCYLAPILGVRELSRILFKPEESLFTKILFGFLSIGVFLAAIRYPEYSTLGFACFALLFCAITLFWESRFEDLESLSVFQAKSVMGFFYVGLLPAMAYRILNLENGKIWFLAMLAIVFAGDTLAYVFGRLWGKKKLLPKISPKKTIVGSVGGLFGSVAAGLLIGHFFLPSIPGWAFVIASVCTGAIAQLGDLFESMLKRVANRKDSGSLMPGHGGILDRLDGVLFGAPVLYAFALICEKTF